MNQKDEVELKGSYINFEKAEYTLPEIIDLIAECYNICIYEESKRSKRKVKNQTYFSIYQFIKRKLDEAVIDETGEDPKSQDSTGRKTKYSAELIDELVNQKQGEYFTNLANQERRQALIRYEELAKKWRQEFEDGTYGDFENELNKYREEMRGPDHEAEHNIASMFQQYKFDILMDIVFHHLIILDEKKLRTDLSIALTFGDNDPDVKDMEAMDHLTDKRNYYKWRTEKLKDLFEN